MARENRKLRRECANVGGPGFRAGDVSGEVRRIVQQARSLQPKQNRDHQQVPGAEVAIEPICIAEPAGEIAKPVAYAIVEYLQAPIVLGFVALQDDGQGAFEDRWFNRI